MSKILIFLLGFCFLNQNISAKPLTDQELNDVQKGLKSHKYVQLKFEETRFKSLRGNTVTSTGTAIFMLPSNNFVWSHDKKRSSWIYDGKNFMQYNGKTKTAVSYGRDVERGRELKGIIALVTDFSNLKKNYQIKRQDLENGILKVDMEPKASGELESVNLEFDTQKNHIVFLKLNFKGGNHTRYKFYDFNGQKFSASRFKLPAGTEVKTVTTGRQ